MTTIVLNSHNYAWANWTPTGLSRFAFAGAVVSGTSNLTFGNKTTSKTVTGQAVLSIPVVSTEDSECGCTGTILRQLYTTIRRDCAPNATAAELTEGLARLRSLVLTSQFENWFIYGTLPV